MNTLAISTHHIEDLTDAFKDFNFRGYDLVTVGPADSLWSTFAQNRTLTAKVLLSENREGFSAAGCFTNCTGLTEWPCTDTGRTKDVTETQGMFRGCSNITGSMPWRCSPVTCQRMFMGCSRWDGSGVNVLDFSKTVHPNSMLEMFDGVPMTTRNLGYLLEAIERTLPLGAVRHGVGVGCGHADAICMRRMDDLQAGGVEIVHSGTQEPWDYSFDDEVNEYMDCTEYVYNRPTLDFSDFEGLDGHFVSAYNGCLVAPQWGIYASHYMPPVGFVAVTRTGEKLTVVDRTRGPGDLCLVRFKEVAKTEPVTVFDTNDMNPFFNREKYCEYVAGSGLPCYVLDRNQTPRLFELFWLKGNDAVVGPSVNLNGAKHKKELSSGDSGSIGFLVNESGLALATHVVSTSTGMGTSIGACIDWIEMETGEVLKTGL